MGEVRVGTSRWQYDDWRGTVYPEGIRVARWLAHDVGMFPTVEVNATFYRLARETATQRWAETAPPGRPAWVFFNDDFEGKPSATPAPSPGCSATRRVRGRRPADRAARRVPRPRPSSQPRRR